MSALALYQDYLWFLAALAWLVAGLAWWQLERNEPRWGWLPWSAGFGLVAAVLQTCGVLMVPVQLPHAPPMLGLDLAMGGLAAVQAAGWWWSLQTPQASRLERHGRLVAAALGFGLAWLRIDWPQAGGWGLFASTLGAGACWCLRGRLPAGGCLALGLATLGVLLSNWGPLAGRFFAPLRWADFSAEGGFLFALGGLAAAVTSLVALLRSATDSRALADAAGMRREAGRFGWALGAWLLAGVAIAHFSGRTAQHDFETAALSRARMAAGMVAGPEVTDCLGPALRLDEFRTFRQLQGGTTSYAMSRWLTDARVEPVRVRLARLQRINPDVDDLFIATLREGWIVGALFPPRGTLEAGAVSLERAADGADLARWESGEAYFQPPRRNPYGTSVQAWAPLHAPDGAMLGWVVFEFSYNRWVVPQVVSRVQTFAVVALGAFFCVLLLLHRLLDRQREAASVRARAAAAASRMKTTFLATVSHELRTPLQAIRGYAEILETRNESVANRPLFAVLRQQLEVMQRLVGDLLDLCAMEVGALQCVRTPVDVGRLVEDLGWDFRRPAAAKGLALRTAGAADLPARLGGDGVRLRQVIANLLANAVKYTDSGEIWLRVSDVRVDGQVCDFAITVEDTGPGIPEERRSSLFQPFSRLRNSVGREGAGLGLALAAALARNLGGQLRLVHTGPEGSRFRAEFRWPVVAAATEEVREPLPAAGARSVLVADDNAAVRTLFSDYLEGCGLHCELAADGDEAVAALRDGRHDAAVVDLSLPGLDGFEVARRVRRERPADRPLRIVGVSAHAGSSEATAARVAGMDLLLAKPVELAELVRALGLGAAPLPGPGRSAALAAELDRQFRAEVAGLVQEIEGALAAGRWTQVAERAHYLANSAYALQAEELGAGCRALEQAAARTELPAAMRAWDAVLIALRPWLGPPPAPLPARTISPTNQTRTP